MILSGMLNIYGIKNFSSTLSHHTGNASFIAIKIYENQIHFKLLFLLICFFIGSVFSGFIYCDKKHYPKKPCDFTLIFGGIILIFIELFELINITLIKYIEIYLISFYFGMQNAMFITYREVLVRSSHITSYLTDTGFTFGEYLKVYR